MTQPRKISPKPPRLLDRTRAVIRLRHYSVRTEDAYISWIRRFIFFHNVRHPDETGSVEVVAFLSDLAVNRGAAASLLRRQLETARQFYEQDFKENRAGVQLPFALARKYPQAQY